MTNLDNILKSRDITLPTKSYLVKAMVFPVVTYGCESWTIKKSERWRIDAFELWCWRRLLRVPWTARRSNQSILKEISPDLAPWSKELTHWKRPDAEKDWRQKEKGVAEGEMVKWNHWLNGHNFQQITGDSGGQRSLGCYSPWGRKEWDLNSRLNNNKS